MLLCKLYGFIKKKIIINTHICCLDPIENIIKLALRKIINMIVIWVETPVNNLEMENIF